MQKTLIFFDEKKHESFVSSIEEVKKKIQHLIDSFNALEIGSFEPKQLETLIYNTEQYLFENTMRDVPLKVNGLQLNKKQFYDMIDKPSGYHKLKLATADFILMLERRLKYEQSYLKPKEYIHRYLQFSEAGELVIADGVVESSKESCSMYVNTEKGKFTFEFATKLVDLINEESDMLSKAALCNTKENLFKWIADLMNYDSGMISVKLNPHAVKLCDK